MAILSLLGWLMFFGFEPRTYSDERYNFNSYPVTPMSTKRILEQCGGAESNGCLIGFTPASEFAHIKAVMIANGFNSYNFQDFDSADDMAEHYANQISDVYVRKMLIGIVANSTLSAKTLSSSTNLAEGVKETQEIRYTFMTEASQYSYRSSYDTRTDFYSNIFETRSSYYDENSIELAMQSLLDAIILDDAKALNLPRLTSNNPIDPNTIGVDEPLDLTAYASNISFRVTSATAPFRYRTFLFREALYASIPIAISAILIATNVSVLAVAEKASRIREALRMMGLSDFLSYLGWVGSTSLLHLPSAIGSPYLVLIFRREMPFLLRSNPIYHFLLILFLVAGVAAQALCLSSFFNSPKSAAIATPFFVATLSALGMGLAYLTVPTIHYAYPTISDPPPLSQGAYLVFGTLFPISSLVHGLASWGYSAQDGNPLTFGSLFRQSPSGFAPVTILAVQIASIIVLGVIYVYFQQVFSGEFGFTRPWYYPISDLWKLCWSGRNMNNVVSDQKSLSKSSHNEYHSIGDIQRGNIDEVNEASSLREDDFEAEIFTADGMPRYNEAHTLIEPVDRTRHPHAAVRIDGLRKSFLAPDSSEIVAVKGLTMSLYEGEILTLLGHNGAGKTTLINCLTGMYPPTSGDATIFGLSATSEMPLIQKFMGVCPQHDILFTELSVLEHFRFFGRLRGIPLEQIEVEAKEWIHRVGLDGSRLEDANNDAYVGDIREDKTNARAGTLSGGQRRKLSVALAFFGNARIVFLDEPSSGLDVDSQRQLWSIISNAREGRVIVLTTHSMEEAELGDRIAIMARGTLQCLGTSLFLKTNFGSGYSLTINREVENSLPQLNLDETEEKGDEKGNERGEEKGETVSDRSSEAIDDVVSSIAPYAKLCSLEGGEMVYILPPQELGNFPVLIDALEGAKQSLGIVSIGLSFSSLTDVFTKVADGEDLRAQAQYTPPADPLPVSSSNSSLSINDISQSESPDSRVNLNHTALFRTAADFSEETAAFQRLHAMASTESLGNRPSSSRLQKISWFSAATSVFFRRVMSVRRNMSTIILLVVVPSFLALLVNIFRFNFYSSSEAKLGPIETREVGVRAMKAPGGLFLTANPNLKDDSSNAAWDFTEKMTQKVSSEAPVGLQPITVPLTTSSSWSLNWEQAKSGVIDADFEPLQKNYFSYLKDEFTVSQKPSAKNTEVHISMLMVDAQGLPGFPSTSAPEFSILNSIMVYNSSYSASYWTAMNLVTNTLLESVGNTSPTGKTVVVRPHLRSFQPKEKESNGSNYRPNNNTPLWLLVVPAFAGLAIAIALGDVLRESESGSRALLFSSGLNPLAYWISNFVVDCGAYLLYIAICLAILGISGVLDLKNGTASWAIAHIILAGPSGVAFIYAASTAFTKLGAGLAATASILMVAPYACVLLDYFFHASSSMVFFAVIIKITYLHPLVVLTQALLTIVLNDSSTKGLIRYQWLVLLYPLILGTSLVLLAFIEHARVTRIFPFSIYTVFNGTMGEPYQDATALRRGLPNQGMTDLYRSLRASQAADAPSVRAEREYVETGRAFFGNELGNESDENNHVQTEHLSEHQPISSSFSVTVRENNVDEMVEEREEAILEPEYDSSYAFNSGVEPSNPNPLVFFRLRKVFPGSCCRRVATRTVALENFSLTVPQGQCIGLLGPSGAGKTTAVRIAAAQMLPSLGGAYVTGRRADYDPINVRKEEGHCPQYDALLDRCTVREHMELHGQLRGYTQSVLRWFVPDFARLLGLSQYLDVFAETLSGGNKRKLSVGLALLGDPSLILLDEPSTGVDPKARRAMWGLIAASAVQRSVVLSTHSMEECEALCDRIAIVTGGRLRALGSTAELKATHGAQVNITIRIRVGMDEATETLVRRLFPTAQILEKNGAMIVLSAPKIHMSTSNAIRVLERARNDRITGVETYSVCDTTLKQVFVSIAAKYARSRQ